ncbi:MAG: hypothetical protein ACRYHA_24800, partial [Janthinobacterium lividum]
IARVDTLVLAALLARIEDERIGVRDALDELDRTSLDLRALRAFKKVFDDFALGKDADAKVSRDDLVKKDGKPVMITVPMNTTLVDAMRRNQESADDIHLAELEKKKLDPMTVRATYFEIERQFGPGRARTAKNTLARLPEMNAKIDAEIAAWRRANAEKAAALANGRLPTLEVELSAAANHFNILLSVSQVSDVQKLIEQINNLISEESTEAQKLSTVANDKYQQLTQLVRELSGMIRMRHEGRLSTVNRI